jgi:hypothetical protein
MKPKLSHLDGWLYVGIAVAGCVLNHLTTKEAQDLFPAGYIFFLKLYADVLGASCLAAKTYRSTTFAQITNQTSTPPSETVAPNQPTETK